jgi:hypothetical protein
MLVFSYITPRPDAKLIAYTERAVMNGTQTVLPYRIEVSYNSEGYAEVNVPETQTISATITKFEIRYSDSGSNRIIAFKAVIIPNTATINLINIPGIQIS